MAEPSGGAPDDERFLLARNTWRQFEGLWLDRPAPTQPVIDGRLRIYQRSREIAAMRHFGVASVLLAGVAKAIADMGSTFIHASTGTDALLFAVTCVVMVVAGMHTLTRMRDAVEARNLARRIDVEPVQWARVDSLFADTRDPDVRAYIDDVRSQGRALRRAEAAILYERARGGSPFKDASDAAFRQRIRGRPAVQPREYATAALCVLALLLVNQQMTEPPMVLPPLVILAAWSLGDLLGNVVELLADPWELKDGGAASASLRRLLWFDLSPSVGVIFAVIVIHIAVGTLPAG